MVPAKKRRQVAANSRRSEISATRHPRRGRSQPRMPHADSSRVVPARLSGMRCTLRQSRSREGEERAERDVRERSELQPERLPSLNASRRVFEEGADTGGGFLVSAREKRTIRRFAFWYLKAPATWNVRTFDGWPRPCRWNTGER